MNVSRQKELLLPEPTIFQSTKRVSIINLFYFLLYAKFEDPIKTKDAVVRTTPIVNKFGIKPLYAKSFGDKTLEEMSPERLIRYKNRSHKATPAPLFLGDLMVMIKTNNNKRLSPPNKT